MKINLLRAQRVKDAAHTHARLSAARQGAPVAPGPHGATVFAASGPRTCSESVGCSPASLGCCALCVTPRGEAAGVLEIGQDTRETGVRQGSLATRALSQPA